MQEHTIILLSCSHEKQRIKEHPFDNTIRRFTSSDALPSQHEKLLNRRRRVFDLLQRQGHGRLHNIDQKGGYRDEREVNQNLLLGPDLGGMDVGKSVYLPAYERYRGRFFRRLNDAMPGFWSELRGHPIEILFVSGLYGLLYWDELIQEYDCHLGDDIEGEVQKSNLAGLWQSVLTDTLCEFIKTRRVNGSPVRNVFDMLSEELYQDMFAWGDICNKAGVRVHHRVFRPATGINTFPLTGADELPLIAQTLATSLPGLYEESKLFKRGEWLAFPKRFNSPYEFGFEYPRMSERGKVIDSVLAKYPELNKLARDVREQLAVAENSWQKAQSISGFDTGVLVIPYTKSVELWLSSVLYAWRTDYESLPEAFRKIPDLKPLAKDATDLWAIRGDAAHPEIVRMTNERIERARQLTFKILRAGARMHFHEGSQSMKGQK